MTMSIIQGSTHRRTWPVSTPDGEAIDWTGWSARAQARPTAASETVLHEWIGDGLTLNEDGSLTLVTAPADSLAWEWSDGVFDIEVTDPDGGIARYPIDRVAVIPAVTRS